MDAALETLARADGVTGELTLRRRVAADPRVDPVYELIVDGVFLMDTAETSTERLLADAVLDRLAVPRRILVGGMGLGVTLAALLTDVRVDRVDVVEIEPLLVRWLRAGLVPPVDAVLADPRVHVTVADISDVLRDVVINTYDGVLLDVDNGPDFLVRAANAAVYRNASMRDVWPRTSSPVSVVSNTSSIVSLPRAWPTNCFTLSPEPEGASVVFRS